MVLLTRAEFDVLTRRDLYTFVRRVFAELNPGKKFHGGRHLEFICSEVAAMMEGDNKRLVLNLPPRNLKSIIVSVAFVAWVLGLDPSKRFLLVSYGQNLPESLAKDCLKVMESGWYRALFPRTRLDPDFSRADDFRTTRNGRLKVESILGGITGFGADYIIIDDPLKPGDATTEHSRQKVNLTLQNSVLSRQDGLGNARVILVMQRIHEDDPTGFLMSRQPWRQIRLPAIAEEDERFEFVDAFGARKVFSRREGEALNPAYESLDALLAQKELVGDYEWAAQYQGRPAPKDGGIFKVDMFHLRPRSEFPATFDLKIVTWDTGSKEGVTNDFSVGIAIGVHDAVRYVLGVYRAKHEFPKLKRAVLDQREIHRPDFIIIEEKGSGQELIPELRDLGVYEVRGALPAKSKILRAEAQSGHIEGGSVIFPSDAPWLKDLVYEFSHFPRGKHDDQVDALCQGLQWIREHISVPPFFRYIEEEKAKQAKQQLGGKMVKMRGPLGTTLQLSGLPSQQPNDGIYDVPEDEVGRLMGAGFRLLDQPGGQ